MRMCWGTMRKWNHCSRKDKKLLGIIEYVCVVLGAGALIYYVWMLGFIGFRVDFSLIWPCFFVGTYALAFILHHVEITGDLTWNRIAMAVLGVGIAGMLVLTVLEIQIIRTGFTTPEDNADYVIVLGAHVRGTKITKALQCRLDKAVEYLERNPDTQVIVSGGQGHGEDITEAEAMSRYLKQNGITAERIIEEKKSTDTNENIAYSKRFIPDGGYVVIVTNRFHLFRSLKITKKQLSSCKIQGSGARTGNGLFLNYYIREAAGVIKDTLAGNM